MTVYISTEALYTIVFSHSKDLLDIESISKVDIRRFKDRLIQNVNKIAIDRPWYRSIYFESGEKSKAFLERSQQYIDFGSWVACLEIPSIDLILCRYDYPIQQAILEARNYIRH